MIHESIIVSVIAHLIIVNSINDLVIETHLAIYFSCKPYGECPVYTFALESIIVRGYTKTIYKF